MSLAKHLYIVHFSDVGKASCTFDKYKWRAMTSFVPARERGEVEVQVEVRAPLGRTVYLSFAHEVVNHARRVALQL